MSPAALYRDMAPADVRGGLALCRLAGWNQRDEDWRALLELSPRSFRVAEREGQVVGTGGAACYGRELAWVCMILVHPEHRGRGIATRLMEDVLDRVAGWSAVGLDATPAGRPVYARLGFVDAGGLARFGRPAPPGRLTPEPPPRARPLTARDVPEVLRWDREAFGADRSPVLRWALAQAPEYAWCLPGREGLIGYCFGRHGHHSEHVGPVVARAVEHARELVAAAARAAGARRVIVDAPTADPAWVSTLEELAFSAERPFTRMFRAPARAPGRAAETFAVLGPEFG